MKESLEENKNLLLLSIIDQILLLTPLPHQRVNGSEIQYDFSSLFPNLVTEVRRGAAAPGLTDSD